MSRCALSVFLALSLLLPPNLRAADSIDASSLRPINSRETEPVLDKLTSGLEERIWKAIDPKSVTNRVLKNSFIRTRRWVQRPGRVSPAALAVELARSLRRLGIKELRWRQAVQLQLERIAELTDQQGLKASGFQDGDPREPALWNALLRLRWMMEGGLLSREEVEAGLKGLDRSPYETAELPHPAFGSAPVVGWVLDEFLRALAGEEILLLGSFLEDFPKNDTDLHFLAQLPASIRFLSSGTWVLVDFHWAGPRRIFVQEGTPEQIHLLATGPHLRLKGEDILHLRESRWYLDGKKLARLFRQIHQKRDGIRRRSEKSGRALSELQIARQAASEIQAQMAAQSAGLEEYWPIPIEAEPELVKRLEMEVRLEEYRDRLVEDRFGRRFLVKLRELSPPSAERLGHIWPDKNNPVREYVASQVGAALGANVAEVVVPPLAVREDLAQRLQLAQRFSEITPDDVYLVRVSYNYPSDDPAIKQRDFKKAFTRGLVALGIFPRKYNFHHGNLGLTADRKAGLFFDHDQAFNPHYSDIQEYAPAMIRSYFGILSPFDPYDLLEWIDLEELAEAVKDAEETDLDRVRDETKHRLALAAYSGTLPDPTAAEVDGYFDHLKKWQKTIRSDTLQFFSILFSSPYDSHTRIFTLPILTMDRITAQLVSPAGSQPQAGWEETDQAPLLKRRLFNLEPPSMARSMEQMARQLVVTHPEVPYVPMAEMPQAIERLFAKMDLRPKQRLLEVGPGSDGGVGLIAALKGLHVVVVESGQPFQVDLRRLKEELASMGSQQARQLDSLLATQRFATVNMLEKFREAVAPYQELIQQAGGSLTVIPGDFAAQEIQQRVKEIGPFDHVVATDVMDPGGGRHATSLTATTTAEEPRVKAILDGLAQVASQAKSLYVSFIGPEEGPNRLNVLRTFQTLEQFLQARNFPTTEYDRMPSPSSGGILSARLYRSAAGMEESPMDARITRAQELMDEGRVKEAALEILETLEDLALDGGLKFTRWEDARELLIKADETLDLESVIGPLVPYYLKWLKSFPTMEMNPALTKVRTFDRVMLDHLLTFWQEQTGIKPSQTLRQHWSGETPSGLEEVSGEVARELRRWGDVGSVSDPFLVLDAERLPMVTRVHRILLNLPSAQDPATRPLMLVQGGLLGGEVLGQLGEIGWQVEELPAGVSEEALPAQVTGARSRWSGPVLVVVGAPFEEAVKKLSSQTRITGVILDPGFPSGLLLSFLHQALSLPGRIFRLEYGIRSGFEEFYAVSTQL